MAGLPFSARGAFSEVRHYVAIPHPYHINVDTNYSIILSSLWNLIVSFLLSSSAMLLSLVVSLNIAFNSTQKFRRFATSSYTASKLDDN